MQPLLTVWTNIRGTARYMIDYNTYGLAILFLIIGSIGAGFGGMSNSSSLNIASITLIAIGSFIFGGIFIVLYHCISTLILLGVGKLFKGVARFSDLFKATSLAYIPSILLSIVYAVWFIVDRDSFYLDTADMTTATSGNAVMMTIVGLVSIITGVYAIVIQVVAVSEAHQFSIGKAIMTVLIPLFIFIIIIIAFVFLVIGLFIVNA